MVLDIGIGYGTCRYVQFIYLFFNVGKHLSQLLAKQILGDMGLPLYPTPLKYWEGSNSRLLVYCQMTLPLSYTARAKSIKTGIYECRQVFFSQDNLSV